MPDTETTTEYLYFEPHVEFKLLCRGNFFNEDGSYYEKDATGSITHLIQFGSTPCSFETTTITIDTNPNSNGKDLEIFALTVLPNVNEIDLLAGTLPGDIYFNDIIKAGTDIYPEFADYIDYEEYLKNRLPAKRDDVKIYHDSKHLLIRKNSTTDLTQLLFISDGTKTSMTNDVFLREITRVFTPDYYNHTTAEPQSSGWGFILLDTELLDDMEKYGDASYQVPLVYTSPVPMLYGETSSELTYFGTSIPHVYLNNEPEYVYTNSEGFTVSTMMTVDFGSLTDYIVEAENINEMENPYFLLFKCNQQNSMTDLIAFADPLELNLINAEDKQSADVSDKITALSIKLNVVLHNLIII